MDDLKIILVNAMFTMAVLLIFVPGLRSQTATGTITGTVKDASGAVVPDVKIKLSNPDTGLVRDTTTTGSGDYTVPLLPAATYRVEAEKAGFQKAIVEKVDLLVNQVARVDLTMQLGSVTQTVEVKATVATLQTDTSSVGAVMQSSQIRELPLNGRQFLQLAVIEPGVVPAAYATVNVDFCCRSISFFFTGQNNATVTANGQREYSNTYLLDGVDNRNAVAGSVGIQPSIEAIQEFKIQTNSFSPEFGFSPTVINIVTRSGVNEYHGSFFEFLRNDVLDSRNFFDASRPPYRQNQFGAVLSGPLSVPHVYNAKDHTFFMLNYEGYRSRKENTFIGRFATPAERAGNFSADPTIYDPATYNPVTTLAQPFQGNVIPASRISTVYTKTLPYVPLPNLPSTAYNAPNYIATPNDRRDFDQANARLDQRVSGTDNIFARWSDNNSPTLFPGYAPLYGTPFIYTGRNLGIGETHTFGPAAVNEFRLGWQKTRNFRLAEGNYGSINYAADVIGLKNVSSDPSNFGLPNFNPANISSIAPNSFTPQGGLYEETQITDTLSLLRGRHDFKMGGGVNWITYDGVADLNPRGSVSFSGLYTSDRLGGSPRVGWADFFLGIPDSATVGFGDSHTYLKYNSFDIFLNDDFKATPRLTLNLGMRWEFTQPYHDVTNGLCSFDTDAERVLCSKTGGVRNGILDPDWHDFSPRVGLAWRPFGEKTVFRAAYGIFYDTFEFNDIQFIKDNAPDLIFESFNNDRVTPQDIDTWFPTTSVSSFAPFGMNRHNRTPYYQDWNLAGQRQLTPSMYLDVAYVGSKGTHLAGRFNWNQARLDVDPTHPTPVDSRRPHPGFTDIYENWFQRNSIYNSIQAKLVKTFTSGMSFVAAFTQGRAIDTVSQSAGDPQNILCVRCDRGLSDLNQSTRFTLSYTYQLPFGPGRHFLSGTSGVPARFVEGWAVNGITTFNTGFPYSAGGESSNTGGFVSDYANRVCNPNLPRGQRTVEEYFKTSCIVDNAPGTFGNAGRNDIIGPGTNDWDLSIFKNFTLGKMCESCAIQFRSEFFNIFNHASFVGDSMGTSPANSFSFGRLFTALDGREIQFALKFLF